MENRKFVRFLIPVLLALGFFVFNATITLAYEVETHAYLTSEIFDFYNKNFTSNKISEELRSYLVDGARREAFVPQKLIYHLYLG